MEQIGGMKVLTINMIRMFYTDLYMGGTRRNKAALEVMLPWPPTLRLFCATAPAVGSSAPRDLMILSFDNQRANSLRANASKRRLNAPKR